MFFSLAVILMLGACNGKDMEAESQSEGTGPSEKTEYHFLEEGNSSREENESKEEMESGEGTADGEKIYAWNDNFLDDYYAVINHPVEKTVAEGEEPTGGRVFVGEGGCICHGSHMYKDYKKNWNGANGMTADGKEFSAQIVVAPGPRGNPDPGPGARFRKKRIRCLLL